MEKMKHECETNIKKAEIVKEVRKDVKKRWTRRWRSNRVTSWEGPEKNYKWRLEKK